MTNIRESIAYNKDLITGVETVMKKYKDVDAPMINTMTIELFDAETGKKTYEAKAENVVNNLVSKMAYMEFFYNRVKGPIGTSVYSPPFQVIVLTDYAQAENADQQFMAGNIIGWADKATAYAGTDNLRGTINLAETQLDVNKDGILHFVFDFPTNAANGTFQTIWWNISCKPTLSGGANNNGYLYNALLSNGTHWFVCKGSSTFQKYTAESYNYLGEVTPTGLISANYTGADCDGMNCWIFDVTGKKLYKLALDMSAVISTLATGTFDTANWGNAQDMTILNGKMYVFTDKYFKVECDLVTGVYSNPLDLRSRLGKGSTYSGSGGITTDGTYIIISLNDYSLAVLDLNFNLICFLGVAGNGTGAGTGYKACFNRTNKYVYNGAYTNSQWIFWSYFGGTGVTPAAQNLLAAPVTKTPTNTMKIQYDFQVQKVL